MEWIEAGLSALGGAAPAGPQAASYAKWPISGAGPARNLALEQTGDTNQSNPAITNTTGMPALTSTTGVSALINASGMPTVANTTGLPAIGANLSRDGDDQDAIVNVTREYPLDYALVMLGYIMPFVFVITLITNSLVIIVLWQRHMRTPTNIVLMTMAFVDIGTIASPSPWYFYIYTLGHYNEFIYPPAACYAHYVMTDVIPIFLHTSSIWLALLLASQRYIYVCHPTLSRTWCTVPRVKRAIFAILMVAFLHQVSHFFDNQFSSIVIEDKDKSYHACKNEIAPWVSLVSEHFYYLSYYIFRIFVVFAIPCIALLTLNILLFRALRRAEKKRTELLRTKFKLVGMDHIHKTGQMASTRANNDNNSNNNQIKNHQNLGSARFEMARELSSYTAAAATADASRRLNSSNSRPAQLFRNPAKPAARDKCSEGTAPGQNDNKDSCPRSRDIKWRNEPAVGERALEAKVHSEPLPVVGNKSGRGAESGCQLDTYAAMAADDEVEDEEGEGEDEEDTGEELTCAECAAYEELNQRQVQQEQQLQATGQAGCRRCMAILNAGIMDGTCNQTDQHQVISQCSSILGGQTTTTTTATTTTTNTNEEDASSSCLAINSANQICSCSMFASTDGARVGAKLIFGESNLTGRQLAHNDPIQAHELSADDSPMKLRGRERNLAGPIGSAGSAARRDSSSSSGGGGGSSSIESHLACGCLKAKGKPLRRANLLSSANLSELLSSKSQPTHTGCSAASARADELETMASSTQSNQLLGRQISSGSSASGAGNSSEPHKDNRPSVGKRCTHTGAKSINSLLQVSPAETRRTSDSSRLQLTANEQRRAKSPSVASSMGRGSRATLMGSGGVPLIVTAGSQLAQGAAASTPSASSGRTMDSNRTTMMLIVVVTVFLVVEVPVAIVTILHVLLNSFDVFRDVELNTTLNYTKLFTNFFIMISYSINFTIYCSMSRKFRETFRDLFFCNKSGKEREEAKRMMYQTQQVHHSQYVTPNNQQQQQFSAAPPPIRLDQTQGGVAAAAAAGQPASSERLLAGQRNRATQSERLAMVTLAKAPGEREASRRQQQLPAATFGRDPNCATPSSSSGSLVSGSACSSPAQAGGQLQPGSMTPSVPNGVRPQQFHLALTKCECPFDRNDSSNSQCAL